MKKIHIGLFILIAVQFLTSCQEWLDVKPKTEVESDDLFKTEEGFQAALAGVYTAMSSNVLYGREMTFGTVDAMGGVWEVSKSTDTYSEITEGAYEGTNARRLIDSLWSKSYQVIANCNNILSYIDRDESIFSGDNYSIIKGEVYALRAYLHFDLLRLYGVDLKSENKEAGIPYQDTLSKRLSTTQSPKEVVELIRQDLLKAKEELEVDPIKRGIIMEGDPFLQNRHYHLNYYGVLALLTRVEYSVGNYDIALEYANEIINRQSEEVFRWITHAEASNSTKEIRDRTFSTEHIFALNIIKLENYIDNYFYSTLNPLLRKADISALHPVATDYRLNYYEPHNTVSNVPSKLWQLDPVLINNEMYSYPKDRMPLIRLSEIYYMYALMERDNPANALVYLNEVLVHRGYTEDDLYDVENISSPEMVLEIIEDEMEREFVSEGQLFYHYKLYQRPGANGPIRYILPKPETELEFGN